MRLKALLGLLLLFGIASLGYALLGERDSDELNRSLFKEGQSSSVTSFLEMLGSSESVSGLSSSEEIEEEAPRVLTPSAPRPETTPRSAAPPDSQTSTDDLTAFSQTIGGLFGSSEGGGVGGTTRDRSRDISVRILEEELEKRKPLSAPGGPPVPQPAPERPIETPEATPTPSPTPEEDPWVFGQARGYTMLYAMQPGARRTVETEIDTLLSARLRQGYLGVLIDGTFGWDPQYLSLLIRRLNTEGRTLTLVLYVTNGPTMRKFDTTPIDTDFSRIDPEEFRSLIQFDPVTRDRYRSLARRALPLFTLNLNSNPRNTNIVIPMLEDNLDEESYRAIAELTEITVGAVAEIVRNPCPGCFSGNDASRNGGQLELHGLSDLTLAIPRDSYSFDGSGYHLRSESGFSSSLPLSEAKELFRTSLVMRLRYVGLWRPDRQGLTTAVPLHPDERNYSVPTFAHIEAEKDLLRFGLPEETTNENNP